MEKESRLLIEKMEEGFREDIPNESVRRVIENAMQVFVRRGLSGARVSDIAKEAGFSQGFVYNHFKSKDDVFTEISRLAAGGSLRVMKEVAGLEGNPYKKIFWLTEALTAPGTLAQMHFKLILMQTISYEIIPGEVKKIFKESAKKQIKDLCEILEEGQKAGEIADENPVKLAMGYFAVVQGMAVMRMQSEKQMFFPDIDSLLGFLKKKDRRT